MRIARPCLMLLVIGLGTIAGCVDPDDDAGPDQDGAVMLDGKADGAPSRESYRAAFSPGLLRSRRAQRLVKGLQSTPVGFARGVGCEVIRADTWKTKDLEIKEGAVFAVSVERMSFLRYSSGQLGFSMRMREYPDDLNYVPLELQCWGYEMPTADAARDALEVGSYGLSLAFTPSNEEP